MITSLSAGCIIADTNRMPLAFLPAWAHCWLTFSQVLANNPRFISSTQPSSRSATHLQCCLGFLWRKCRTQHLILLNFIPLSSAQQSACPSCSVGPSCPQADRHFLHLGVICKRTEGALSAPIQIIHKGIKQDRSQYQPLGTTTHDRLPAGCISIHHHSLGPAHLPILYPAKCKGSTRTAAELSDTAWHAEGWG